MPERARETVVIDKRLKTPVDAPHPACLGSRLSAAAFRTRATDHQEEGCSTCRAADEKAGVATLIAALSLTVGLLAWATASGAKPAPKHKVSSTSFPACDADLGGDFAIAATGSCPNPVRCSRHSGLRV